MCGFVFVWFYGLGCHEGRSLMNISYLFIYESILASGLIMLGARPLAFIFQRTWLDPRSTLCFAGLG